MDHQGLYEAYLEVCQKSEYNEALQYLLGEGYTLEESNLIIDEFISEGGLGSLAKGARALLKFVAKRAKTPGKTAAIDSLVASTALNPVSSANIAKNIAKGVPSATPVVRQVTKSARTAPKGANRIVGDVWNEPTAPSSRIPPSKPSGTQVSSTRALAGTPQRLALPAAGQTSAKKSFDYIRGALPRAKGSTAEPAGALVSTRAPKPQFKPEALPRAKGSTAEPAGALAKPTTQKPSGVAPKPELGPGATLGQGQKNILPLSGGRSAQVKSNQKAPTPPSGGDGGKLTKPYKYTAPDSGLPFRATGPGGDARTQRLAAQASGSTPKSPKKSMVGPALAVAGAGALGIGAAISQTEKEKQKKAESDARMRSNIKTDVYNTRDYPSVETPSGKIRDRLKVGSREVGSTFDDAYREAQRKRREARRIGDQIPSTFTYGGKEYSVDEGYLIDYLLGEGFASDEKSALAMIGSMSEEWITSVFEI